MQQVDKLCMRGVIKMDPKQNEQAKTEKKKHRGPGIRIFSKAESDWMKSKGINAYVNNQKKGGGYSPYDK